MADKEIKDDMSEEDRTLHEMKLKKTVKGSADKEEETQPAEPEKKEEQPK